MLLTIIINIYYERLVSRVVLVVKNPLANAGDVRDVCLIPRLGQSVGGGHGNPLQYSYLENPHPSILAWRIQWTEEPGGLLFMGSERVGQN